MAEFYSATIRLSDRFRGRLLLRDLQECLPNCYGTGNPAKYPPVTAGAYNQESLGRAFSFARQ